MLFTPHASITGPCAKTFQFLESLQQAAFHSRNSWLGHNADLSLSNLCTKMSGSLDFVGETADIFRIILRTPWSERSPSFDLARSIVAYLLVFVTRKSPWCWICWAIKMCSPSQQYSWGIFTLKNNYCRLCLSIIGPILHAARVATVLYCLRDYIILKYIVSDRLQVCRLCSCIYDCAREKWLDCNKCQDLFNNCILKTVSDQSNTLGSYWQFGFNDSDIKINRRVCYLQVLKLAATSLK